MLDWLGYRRNRRPRSANPHLLITRKTADELGPAVKLWTTRATRNLTAALGRLRVGRRLEEALTHGVDPLALVFGADEKTAIRYADSACALPERVSSRDHRRQWRDLRPEHGRGPVLPSPALITKVGCVTAGSALRHARVSFPASA